MKRLWIALVVVVLTTAARGVSAITVFLDPTLFAAFGMPLTR